MTETFDLGRIYRDLKDFQLATVDHVADRLYGDDATTRFLVADEVGLGKTLVARGLIARTIERHLDRGTDRIDIVYICSNADIARQNIGRLNVLGRNDFNLATRITLLPLILAGLQGNRINLVSFTPGTSFNLRSSEGIMRERALLYWMLRELWGHGVIRAYKRDTKVFAGGASYDNFSRLLQFWRGDFDEGLAEQFAVRSTRWTRGARVTSRPCRTASRRCGNAWPGHLTRRACRWTCAPSERTSSGPCAKCSPARASKPSSRTWSSSTSSSASSTSSTTPTPPVSWRGSCSTTRTSVSCCCRPRRTRCTRCRMSTTTTTTPTS